MIRRVLLAVALTAAVAVTGAGVATADAPATHFTAHLTGAQEVPANNSPATGRLDLRLTDNGTKLRFRLAAEGLDKVTQAHIHLAVRGVNGSVVVFFFAPVPATFGGGSVTGEDFMVGGVRTASDVGGGSTFAELIAALRSGGAYVNIHSPQHPGGEIRGQIGPAGEDDGD